MRILHRLLASIVGMGLLLSCLDLFHLGWGLWQFSQLTGAFIGGFVTLFAIWSSKRPSEEMEPWLGQRTIGMDTHRVWRYYVGHW